MAFSGNCLKSENMTTEVTLETSREVSQGCIDRKSHLSCEEEKTKHVDKPKKLPEIAKSVTGKGQFLPLGTSISVPEGVHRSWRYCNTRSMRGVDGASSYSNSLLQKSI